MLVDVLCEKCTVVSFMHTGTDVVEQQGTPWMYRNICPGTMASCFPVAVNSSDLNHTERFFCSVGLRCAGGPRDKTVTASWLREQPE